MELKKTSIWTTKQEKKKALVFLKKGKLCYTNPTAASSWR